MRRSGRTLADVADQYSINELVGGEDFALGGVNIKTTPVDHTIATYAMRCEARGRVILMSGDLIYSETLSIWAKDADYLIINSGGTIRTSGAAQYGCSSSDVKQSCDSGRNADRRAKIGILALYRIKPVSGTIYRGDACRIRIDRRNLAPDIFDMTVNGTITAFFGPFAKLVEQLVAGIYTPRMFHHYGQYLKLRCG